MIAVWENYPLDCSSLRCPCIIRKTCFLSENSLQRNIREVVRSFCSKSSSGLVTMYCRHTVMQSTMTIYQHEAFVRQKLFHLTVGRRNSLINHLKTLKIQVFAAGQNTSKSNLETQIHPPHAGRLFPPLIRS